MEKKSILKDLLIRVNPYYKGHSTISKFGTLVCLVFCLLLSYLGQSQTYTKAQLLEAYLKPNLHPNFYILAAHRGYWKDVGIPENSKKAYDKAGLYNYDMVEIDIMKSSDGIVFCFHDWILDRLTNGEGIVKKDYNTTLVTYEAIKNFTLKDRYENVVDGEHIPTLEEILTLLRDKYPNILISLDKVNTCFQEAYNVAKKVNVLDRVFIKGTYNSGTPFIKTPNDLKNQFTSQEAKDWAVGHYTPILFSNNIPTDFKSDLDLWISSGVASFEIVYKTDSDPLLQPRTDLGNINTVEYVKSKNKRAGMFVEWPDNCNGTWNSPQSVYKIPDFPNDRRNDWDWVLTKGTNYIIADRVEKLMDLLQAIGKRTY